MNRVSRVDEQVIPRPKTYIIGPFAGPAANASTFKRGGTIIGASEVVKAVRILTNTISTGATVDVAADADATVVTVSAGGTTIATASNAAADITDGSAMTLAAAANLARVDGDVLLCGIATALNGQATQLVDFCIEIETQPA